MLQKSLIGYTSASLDDEHIYSSLPFTGNKTFNTGKLLTFFLTFLHKNYNYMSIRTRDHIILCALQVRDTCKRVLCAVSFCEENNLDWSSWQTNKVTTQLHLCLTESAFCNGAHSVATEPMKHIYFLVKHLSESVKFVVNNRLLSSSPNVQSS